MKYDNLLKEILQDSMPSLLRLLRLPKVHRYLTVELTRRNRVVPDMVIELADKRVLHIDLQVENQANFPWRCLDYYSAIHQVFRPPSIVQVLIYIGGKPLTMESRIRRDVLNYKYKILDLSKVPAKAFLD